MWKDWWCINDCDLQQLCYYSSSLSAQRPALYEPPMTTSGAEKATASLSMIDFALHLHIYVWIINQPAVMA